MSAWIELKALRKLFTGRDHSAYAVDGVDLGIERGQFVTLLGSSGCGKTTTLRLIAGLEIPTSGQILRDGADISDLPAADRDMRMVFQDYALFPNLTVSENVAFGLRLRRMKGKFSAAEIGLEKTFPSVLGPEIEDDHLAVNQAGIPMVDLIDFDYAPWHTLQDTQSHCSAESLGKVGTLLESWLRKSPPFTSPK